jgi:hypothetical protein
VPSPWKVGDPSWAPYAVDVAWASGRGSRTSLDAVEACLWPNATLNRLRHRQLLVGDKNHCAFALCRGQPPPTRPIRYVPIRALALVMDFTPHSLGLDITRGITGNSSLAFIGGRWSVALGVGCVWWPISGLLIFGRWAKVKVSW